MEFMLGNKGAHIMYGNIYSCAKCRRSFKKEDTLQQHICLFCQTCQKTFSKIKYYTSHQCVNSESLTCIRCKKIYTSATRLANHKCTYCSQCSMIYSTFQKLCKHKCTKTTTENKSQTINDENQNTRRQLQPAIVHTLQPPSSIHDRLKNISQINQSSVKNKPSGGIQNVIQMEKKDDEYTVVDSHSLSNSSAKKLQASMCIVSTQSFKFTPVDMNWQLQMCTLLSLPLHSGHSFPTSMKDIGQPQQVQPITGDGSCFFRCISFLVTGNEKYHTDVRISVTDYMKDISSLLQSFVGNMTVSSYIQSSQMDKPGTWATQVELIATAHMLKTDIFTYTKYGETMRWTKSSGKLLEKSLQTNKTAIYLNHRNLNHFEVVLSTTTSVKYMQGQMEQSNIFSEILWQSQKKKLIESPKESLHLKEIYCCQSNIRKKEKARLRKQLQRKNETFRKLENEARKTTLSYSKDMLRKKSLRKDKKYQQNENLARKTPEYHLKNKERMQTVRKKNEQKYQKCENLSRKTPKYYSKDKARKQSLRKDKKYQENEKLAWKTPEYHLKNKERMQTLRKKNEQKYQKCENLSRKTPKYHSKDKARKQALRKDKKYQENENLARKTSLYHLKDKVRKQSLRKDEKYQENENLARKTSEYHLKNKERMQTLRKKNDQKYQKCENLSRKTPKYHSKDKARKQALRKDKKYLENENLARKTSDYHFKDKLRKQSLRKDPGYKQKENVRSKLSKSKLKDQRRKFLLRQSNLFRLKEIHEKRMRKIGSFEILIEQFHKAVEKGPDYVCTCCDQLWYRESVHKVPENHTLDTTLVEKCITGSLSADGRQWICNTCLQNIKAKKLPTCSKANLNTLPNKPEVLDLTNLEERLISPRIPFMQLHELPRGKQLSLHGNVVNVPANVSNTVSQLPRPANADMCIPLKLKRKLSYKHHVEFQNIRPQRVLSALKYLIDCSNLYKEEKIQINDRWDFKEDTVHEKETDNMMKKNKCSTDEIKTSCQQENIKGIEKNSDNQNVCDDEDSWNEVPEEDLPCGTLDTLLHPQDLTSEAHQIFSFAPAEGNSPLGIFMDKYSEELSFPTLFCGKSRTDNIQRPVKISYSDICKLELRSRDRRFASHLPNIFFKFKKLQTKQIMDKANLCLRKTKGNQNLSAGFLKSSENVNNLCRLDEGFRVFRDLRGSPPYWEQAKRDIFAMIRQLGLPTWFASFSSAETRWIHLLQILSRTVHGKESTKDEIMNLDFFGKSELIKRDPVTCSRHFDHQVQKFVNSVLLSKLEPVGKVVDFFYKVEFQMRGSPHIHMLIWVENAPELDETKDSETSVIKFVNKYVCCTKDDDMEDLVGYQQHAHGRTCRKRNKKECRFNFPQPPMRKTCILHPLDDDTPEKDRIQHKHNWQKVKKKLNEMNKGADVELEMFLKDLKLSEEEYIKAVKSSISSKQIFLKRSFSELRINNYNKTLLQCWRANMDLQFIIDAYACAMYSYISKAQRGMSNLLYNATKEARAGNQDIRKQIKSVGHQFLTHVEVSAQEAVYFILQMSLRKASRQVIFINTSPENERVVMLKSFKHIESLPDDSTDIEESNVLKRYADRPQQLENVCLADFCSSYRIVYNKQKKKKLDYQLEDEEEHCLDGITAKSVIAGDGTVYKKRQKQAVIRYVRYNQKTDAENFFRETLMLFYPWRIESEIIGMNNSYEARYLEVRNSSEIKETMSRYNHHSYVLDHAMEELSKTSDEQLEDQWDTVAPTTQNIEHEDIDEGINLASEYQSYQPTTSDLQVYSELSDSTDDAAEIMTNYMPDEKFLSLTRCLNPEQRRFFYHMLHIAKTDESPSYTFLTGGAGVGKTVVIKCLYQALIRYYNRGANNNPDDLKVLLGAPTGKAAYLIHGNTLHSLFKIPANQGFNYKPLSSDYLNTLRCKFQHVQMIIIDEVSMVGNRMLQYIHQRLQQIRGSTKLFGGISVLAVGDLYQLKPVFDGWIFANLTENYGPVASNIWTDNFKIFSLHEIMRQKECADFALLLNRLRECKHSKADIETLKSRIIDNDISREDYPLYTPHIFLKNKLVDDFNNNLFINSKERKLCCKAVDIVVGDVTQEIKEKVKKSIPTDISKTMGLAAEFRASVGMRCEISCNVDVDDGISNGTSCTIKEAEGNDKTGKYSVIWVEFDEELIGKNSRLNKRKVKSFVAKQTWTPIQPIKRVFNVGRYKSVQVIRQQFPLRPAAAKSCHRCQGDTMTTAVVDFTGSCFPHSHYVALSRVKDINSLFIRNLNESKIHIDNRVKQEMQRLNTDMELQTIFDFKDHHFTMLFHNVRSLHKHFNDALKDVELLSPNIITYVETKLTSREDSGNYVISGYELHRFDNPPHYGIAIYLKSNLPATFKHTKQYFNRGMVEFSTLFVEVPDVIPESVQISFAYSSPKTTMTQLKQIVKMVLKEHKPHMIVGDFNIDLFRSNHLTELSSFKQHIHQPTTDYNSILDHVYTDGQYDTKCLTLFVTHYPMLSEFEKVFPGIVGNYHMSFLMNEDSDDNASSVTDVITFLYQLVCGTAARSYGLNVARLADIPIEILNLATDKSHSLEEIVAERRKQIQLFQCVCSDEIVDTETILTNLKSVLSAKDL